MLGGGLRASCGLLSRPVSGRLLPERISRVRALGGVGAHGARSGLHRRLESLAIEAESRGSKPRQRAGGAELAEHEPLSSRVIIRLMSALAAHGDRAGALQQARRYEEEMGRELEAEPNPAVVALADRLRRAPPVDRFISARLTPPDLHRGASPSPGSAPWQTTIWPKG